MTKLKKFKLRQAIYEAIKTPPCSRCKSRPDFKKRECGTHRCDEIYQEEVNAVMAIIEKELNL